MTPVRWDDDDRAKAVAWQEFERQSCPRCGLPPDGDPADYTAFRERCGVCAMIDRELEHIHKSKRPSYGATVRWGIFDGQPLLDPEMLAHLNVEDRGY